MLWLLIIANVVCSSPILLMLMMEIRSSETPVLTRRTLRNIPEEGILHSLSIYSPRRMCSVRLGSVRMCRVIRRPGTIIRTGKPWDIAQELL
jgi:hypothetical protein